MIDTIIGLGIFWMPNGFTTSRQPALSGLEPPRAKPVTPRTIRCQDAAPFDVTVAANFKTEGTPEFLLRITSGLCKVQPVGFSYVLIPRTRLPDLPFHC